MNTWAGMSFHGPTPTYPLVRGRASAGRRGERRLGLELGNQGDVAREPTGEGAGGGLGEAQTEMEPLRNSLEAIFTLTTAGLPRWSVAWNARSRAGPSSAVVSTHSPWHPRARATSS